MKRCSRCGEEKPPDAFARSMRMCRECDKARRWPRRVADNARRRQSRLNNHARDLESQRKYRVATRSAVFAHYGAVCRCCGSDQRLTIDHVDGTGGEHRRGLFGNRQAGVPFYTWLIANDFPAGYQTLCRPCNTSKFTGGQCRIQHSVALETGGSRS